MEEYLEFTLMNKDKKILEFISETNEYNEVWLEETDRYSDRLPVGFEDIQTYIEKRKAPKHREHISRLMKESGCDNLNGFLKLTKALSLNDTFWVKSKDSTLAWDQVSLYRNNFDDTIARLAFEGGDYNVEFSSTSPEYGTEGQCAKCWIRENDKIYLLKTGRNKVGLEPYSEYYASQLAELICKNSVKYDLDIYRDTVVSKCKLFTSEEIGYVPAVKYVSEKEHKRISYLLSFFENLGLEEEFRRMIVLDALILNIDRHAGNYGFLVDNETQDIKGMAPIFDHNLSLLYAVPELDKSSIEDYFKTITPRIGGEFNAAANLVLTPEIKSDLRNLKGFTFDKKQDILFSDSRMKVLDVIVNMQLENILQSKSLYYAKFPCERENDSAMQRALGKRAELNRQRGCKKDREQGIEI